MHFEFRLHCQHNSALMNLSLWAFIALLATVPSPSGVRQEEHHGMQPLCGTTDRWTVQTHKDKVGEGSYGSVQEVKNKQGDTYVMKKARSEKNTTELKNEIGVLGKIKDCPGVVKMKDKKPCDSSDSPIANAYVMDKYKKDLHKYIEDITSPPKCFGYIFIEVLRAVRCMHSQNLIHKDIKTKNVFLSTPRDIQNKNEWSCSDEGFQVAVGDFGMTAETGTEADQFNQNPSNFSYMHSSMFGKGKVEAVEHLDWHSVFELYCTMMAKLKSWADKNGKSHQLFMKSLNEDSLRSVAVSKGFTDDFDDVWLNELNSPKGKCFTWE